MNIGYNLNIGMSTPDIQDKHLPGNSAMNELPGAVMYPGVQICPWGDN
jgi:hypothetical protein